jgi:hypothetical protein
MQYQRRKGRQFPNSIVALSRLTDSLTEQWGNNVRTQTYESVGRTILEWRLSFELNSNLRAEANITRETKYSLCNLETTLTFQENTSEGSVYLSKLNPTNEEQALEEYFCKEVYRALVNAAILDATPELPFR